jgi:protein TonB
MRENARQDHEKSEVMLGSCLVEGEISSASSARRTRREAFGISLVIEILILGLLVAAPLFNSVAQPNFRPILPTQLSFSRPGTLPKRGPIDAAHVINRRSEIPNPYHQLKYGVTVRRVQNEEGPGVPDAGFEGPYLPGGDMLPGGGVAQLIREPEPVAQPPQVEKHPVKISEGVLQAQLITRVEPRYPALAMQTKTEGEVRLHAIINRDGRITSLDILSGHPLLVHAALEAVSQWRYRPTMLNGEPVEVETSITVIFRLHN